MALQTLTNLTSGAPALTTVNGSLCTVLDWALVTMAGWTIEYTAVNARVYRPPSGNRYRLFVQHDSAIIANNLAVWRGCESATAAAAASLVDAFPTVAIAAPLAASVLLGQAANNSTARAYRIYVTSTFVTLTVDSDTAGVPYEVAAFGDLVPSLPEDVYCTICTSAFSQSATAGARGIFYNSGGYTSGIVSSNTVFFARSIDGVNKCTRGSYAITGPYFGSVSNTTTARGGFMNRLFREKVAVSDTGASSGASNPMGIVRRGWIPQWYNPLHTGKGTLASDDTFTDTVYSASAVFRVIAPNTAGFFIIEETDTWSAPSG